MGMALSNQRTSELSRTFLLSPFLPLFSRLSILLSPLYRYYLMLLLLLQFDSTKCNKKESFLRSKILNYFFLGFTLLHTGENFEITLTLWSTIKKLKHLFRESTKNSQYSIFLFKWGLKVTPNVCRSYKLVGFSDNPKWNNQLCPS